MKARFSTSKFFLFLYIIILITSSSNFVLSQTNWNIVKVGFDINAIQFITESEVTGYAACETNILKSTDNGASWKNIYDGNSGDYFWSMKFVDKNTGWVAGRGGLIINTTNGGANWLTQNTGVNSDLININFVDSQTGWACGHDGVIIKTTNGGGAWIPMSSGTTDNLFNSSFVNSNTGWIAGDNGIIKTTNGGNSWISQLSNPWAYSVYFVDANTGYAGFRFGKIFKTTNSGTNWTEQNSSTGATYYSMVFSNADNGIVVGDYNTIIKTNNGGANWVPVTHSISDPFVKYSHAFLDGANPGTVWVCGFQGAILKSGNFGNDWVTKSYGSSYNWFSKFVNRDVGYVVGSDGSILKTNSGGDDWYSQNSGVNATLIATDFVDENTGWTAGQDGVMIKTTNGGNNWIQLNSGSFENFFSIDFINANKGWVVGDGGIFATTDGGNSWTMQLNEPWVYSVCFLNEQLGFAGVRFGKIFKTTDGGATWIQKPSGSGATFYSMSFRNSSLGFAVGDYNTVIKTMDGGESWSHVNTGIGDPGQKYSCVSFGVPVNEHVWISGFGGLILRSTDLGQNWQRQSVPFDVDYNSIQNVAPGIAYAAGAYGIVIKTNNANVTSASSEIFNVPGNFQLEQNYPNPFNPSTTINYLCAASGNIKLKIYNSAGKEMEVLVDEFKNAGYHQVRFSGNNLPSGVYYYSLYRNNEIVQTRKMILIK